MITRRCVKLLGSEVRHKAKETKNIGNASEKLYNLNKPPQQFWQVLGAKVTDEFPISDTFEWERRNILLMAEILHHLGCMRLDN